MFGAEIPEITTSVSMVLNAVHPFGFVKIPVPVNTAPPLAPTEERVKDCSDDPI